MTELAILVAIAAAGFGLSRALHLPVIPLLMLPGILLGFTDISLASDFFENALELGLAFLVFTSGIELNPERFGRQKSAVVWVGILQFVVLGLLGLLAALLLEFSTLEALYIGFGLSTSSTLVVLRHLKQQQQLFEPFGRLVTGVLLIQDLLIILVLVLVNHLEEPWLISLMALGGVVLLFLMALASRGWLMPAMIMRWRLDEETILLSSMALLFAFVGLAVLLKLPTVAGAFFAGFAMSAFPVNGVIRGLLSSISDFFLAIFFTALGVIVFFPSLELVWKAGILVLLIVMITPPLVTVLAEWTGLSSRASIESGLLLAQTSEFSLVLALAGVLHLHISPDIFSLLALVTVLSMALTPFIATDRVTRFLLRFHPVRRRLPTQQSFDRHILMLGFGAAGMWVVKPLRNQGHEVLVVDDDPVVVEQLQKTGIPAIRGDGSDAKILQRAGVEKAKLIIASMRRIRDAEKVLRYSSKIPVVVRVFEDRDADWIRRLGGIPILNSYAAAETFMEWFHKAGPGKK